jgi:hypothetical protein
MATGFRAGGAACVVCGSCEVQIDAVEQGASGAQRAEGERRPSASGAQRAEGERRPSASGAQRAEGERRPSGWLLLAECPRCDHRWTQRLADAPTVGRAVRVAAAPEVANAA